MTIEQIRFDCRFFKGHIPCTPNKKYDAVCPTCTHYKPANPRVLIIKLGAIGDVIRTTPLLTRFKVEHPDVHITWLTLSPAILPKSQIDTILTWNETSLLLLKNQPFDIAINLDKDAEACILLSQIKAKIKYGFDWKDGHIYPTDEAAHHKLLTGLFDNLSISNTKNYLEEIFEICHFDFRGEEYILDVNKVLDEKWSNQLETLAKGKKIIGLNTGCGIRWTTRLWEEKNWIELIKRLQSEGYFPLLLGGKDEHERNQYYHEQTGATYLGTFSLQEFMAITNQCDVIVTAVTMMMHIAIGLRKQMVLFNNIFNKHEFELYGRGQIVEPSFGCDCYYGNTCKRERHCMKDLSVDHVLEAIEQQVTQLANS